MGFGKVQCPLRTNKADQSVTMGYLEPGKPRTETGMANKRTLNPNKPCQDTRYAPEADRAAGRTRAKDDGPQLAHNTRCLSDFMLGHEQSRDLRPDRLHQRCCRNALLVSFCWALCFRTPTTERHSPTEGLGRRATATAIVLF